MAGRGAVGPGTRFISFPLEAVCLARTLVLLVHLGQFWECGDLGATSGL